MEQNYSTDFAIGSRVALAQDYTQLPATVIAQGETGTIVNMSYSDKGFVRVRMDHFPEGFDEWLNELWFDPEHEPIGEWFVSVARSRS